MRHSLSDSRPLKRLVQRLGGLVGTPRPSTNAWLARLYTVGLWALSSDCDHILTYCDWIYSIPFIWDCCPSIFNLVYSGARVPTVVDQEGVRTPLVQFWWRQIRGAVECTVSRLGDFLHGIRGVKCQHPSTSSTALSSHPGEVVSADLDCFHFKIYLI